MIRNLAKAIENLHSRDNQVVLNTLQKSKYIGEVKYEQEVILHTGVSFIFFDQTSKAYGHDLFYDLTNNILIRQERGIAPEEWSRSGIRFLMSDGFYSSSDLSCVSVVNRQTGKFKLSRFSIERYDEFETFLMSYQYFRIVDDERKKVFVFPARKHLSLNLTFDGSTFHEATGGDDTYGSYSRYGGTYAQDTMGFSDDFIDDALEGDPEAYWNLD